MPAAIMLIRQPMVSPSALSSKIKTPFKGKARSAPALRAFLFCISTGGLGSGPGLIALFTEQHLTATGNVEFFQRDWMKIGFDTVTFGGGAINFVAAAIDL